MYMTHSFRLSILFRSLYRINDTKRNETNKNQLMMMFDDDFVKIIDS